MKFGLIAGNGKFPFMVVEGARRSGVPLVVAAIRIFDETNEIGDFGRAGNFVLDTFDGLSGVELCGKQQVKGVM